METPKKEALENASNEINEMIHLDSGAIHNLATALAMAAIAIVESESNS